jgi:hypothetical protein
MTRFPAMTVMVLALAAPAFAQGLSQPLAGKLQFRSVYLDDEDRPAIFGALPGDVMLRFEFIAGRFAGSVNTKKRLVVAARIDAPAQLDLDEVRAAAEPLAAVLSREALDAGLAMTPADARLARLATVAYDPMTRRGVGSTVFRSAATHESLVFVYFDRACRLAGTVRGRGAEITYDVKVDAPGLRMVKITRESPTRYAATLVGLPEQIILRIVPRTPPPPAGSRVPSPDAR